MASCLEDVDIYAIYKVRLRMHNAIMGGTPKDPKLLQGWIERGMGIMGGDEITKAETERTLRALLPDLPEGLPLTKLNEIAAERLAGEKHSNGFKRDPERGLYIEARHVKAMLKENTNILFAHAKWGPTRKGPKGYLAERVFIQPHRIYLDRMEPDGKDLFIGHVMGPRGPQNSLTLVEYVNNAVIECEAHVLDDCLDGRIWRAIWRSAEHNGLGAKRSQGAGTFDVEQLDLIHSPSISIRSIKWAQ